MIISSKICSEDTKGPRPCYTVSSASSNPRGDPRDPRAMATMDSLEVEQPRASGASRRSSARSSVVDVVGLGSYVQVETKGLSICQATWQRVWVSRVWRSQKGLGFSCLPVWVSPFFVGNQKDNHRFGDFLLCFFVFCPVQVFIYL